MYTLRLSRPLLARFPPADAAPSASPTTRLGDWHVRPFRTAGRDLLLCTSELTGLSVVRPARDLPDLPERLVRGLVPVLHDLGVAPEGVAAEIDAMTEGTIAASRNPQMTAAMRNIARDVAVVLRQAAADTVDVPALHRALAARSTLIGGSTPSGQLAVVALRR